MSDPKQNPKGFQSLGDRIRQAEEKGQPEGWNQPPSSVWEGVERNLHSGSRRIWGLVPWLLFMGTGILAIYFWFNMNSAHQQIKEQTGTIQILDDSLQYLREHCKTDTNSLSREMNTRNFQYDQTATESGTIIQRDRNKGTAESIYFSPLNLNLIKDRLFKDETFISPGHNEGSPSIKYSTLFPAYWRDLHFARPQSFKTDNNGRIDPELLDSLSFLPNRPLRLSTTKDIDTLRNFANEPHAKDSEEISQWYFEISSNYGILVPEVEGLNTAVSEALGLRVHNGQTFMLNGSISRKLSRRWALSTGLAYTKNRSVTSYNVDLFYDPDQEIKTPSGDFHLDFEHSIPSAAGNIGLNFGLLRLATDQITTGDTLPFEFEGVQKFHHISLPIQAHFAFLSKDGFEGTLSAGARINYLFGFQTDVKEFKVLHGALHNRYALMESNVEQFNRWNGDIILGAHIRDHFSRNISITLGFQAYMPMSYIYRSGQTSTRFFTYTGSLGFAYHW